jgi:glutaminyl-peptide cyclotransferase
MTIGHGNTVLFIAALLMASMESCVRSTAEQPSSVFFDWRIVEAFPHDTDAFTQGLIFKDGFLYESTGRRGHSSIRKVRLETGEIIRKRSLDPEYFGEGLTEWNGQLIQLTLSSGTGFVYDMETFELIRTFPISGEAWGLTNDGNMLIMSDGSSTLRFLDPETFEETRLLTVTEHGEPVSRLNELQMIGDQLFANILFSNEIAIIDPKSGEVTGRIDLQKLVSIVEQESSVNVLNGIAYDSLNGRIFVTGKLWPKLFEIEIKPRESASEK